MTVDLLLAALRWAKAHHTFVVVDTHPGYDDRTMAMLTLASEILLVVTPEVGAIRNSSQFLGLAREVGLGDIVRVVVNRANHGVRLADIEQALGLPVSATVVSNGPRAVIASNEGVPVITKFPREKIASDLHNVARVVVTGISPTAARRSPPLVVVDAGLAQARQRLTCLAPPRRACDRIRPCRPTTTSAAAAATPSR